MGVCSGTPPAHEQDVHVEYIIFGWVFWFWYIYLPGCLVWYCSLSFLWRIA